MLLLDDRTGSGDLLPHLRTLGVPTTLSRLDFGDAAFVGVGPEGAPRHIGIEIKQVQDVLQCIGDGRFAGHQLPGLVSHYDQVWLIVEGQYRPSKEGVLEVFRRGNWWGAYANKSTSAMYKGLDAWLMTLEIKAGVRFRRSADRWETARILADLYHWWVTKGWDEHKSHLALHETRPDSLLLKKASVLRMVAAQLPGIGWQKSMDVDRHFRSIREMVLASEKEWAKVPGIGKTIAQRLVKVFDGKEAK